VTRRCASAALLLALVLGFAAPAGAIETTRFGIEPARGDQLDVDLRPGHTTSSAIVVWNRRDEPLTLELHLSPATVNADGTVDLAGPDAPVRWSSVRPRRVTLAAGQRREVSLTVRAPRHLPDVLGTVAVIAEPVPDEGDPTPAVLQRLALVGHFHRAGRDLPDLWPLAGVALLAIVAVFAQIVVSRRRLRGSSWSR